MPETEPLLSKSVCERIRSHMDDLDYSGILEELRVTFSIGISSLNLELHKKPEDIINSADRALYQTKENGRDQIVII